MLPGTPNILYAVIAIMACILVYLAYKAWFWRQEALFNDEMWEGFRKRIHSDIVAINTMISDTLAPGGVRAARMAMMKTWVLADAVDAMGEKCPNFTKDCFATFRYKYDGKNEHITVCIPGNILVENSIAAPGAAVPCSTIIDHILAPYSDKITGGILCGRDWDKFDFGNARFRFWQTKEEADVGDA